MMGFATMTEVEAATVIAAALPASSDTSALMYSMAKAMPRRRT